MKLAMEESTTQKNVVGMEVIVPINFEINVYLVKN
jgi:hypothetical protein